MEDPTLLQSDFERAQQLGEFLLKEYADTDLSEIIDCEIVQNEYGETYRRLEMVKECLDCSFSSKEEILSDLKLIRGIGPVTEEKLKEKGYKTIGELRSHEEWGDKAASIVELFDAPDPLELMKIILKWKSPTDSLVLNLSDLHDERDFAILDIETMGLSNQPIILFGLALPGENKVEIRQFLLKDIEQEMAALKEFKDTVEKRSAFLTFNGKSFDIPYIERRFQYYGLQHGFDHNHFDMYHFSRRAWNDVSNYRLNTLEREILGLNRSLDIPSSMVPGFYQNYREEGNPGPLIPILEHNKQDLLSLLELFREVGGEILDGQD
ncbi:hypothetical protein AKJ62_01900 [candidate division MSBL1 archaeon SCGC-AAA259D14]|uniref:YprB ribonuclease H-like domain-containing protein n=1 Tax=candidate division MSBL1 archaeon SCGC-AAA259D14 TaxID=1698261 RepID=A0A133U735_9EURY|nr:hypothetical protein AKJ62_01900 [candidate division MSBL1 archaeon SCGC-AAA259D14]